MRTLRALLPIAAASLWVGVMSCSPGAGTHSPAALPMQGHWEAGQDLQTAMANGDLSAARRAASAIAEVKDIQGLGWDAGPYLMRVQKEAATIEAAAHFDDAVQAAGRLGTACGACHARSEGGPHPEGATTAPDDAGDTESHMLRHRWAVDRMWEGLVVPSVERWRAGARLLAEQPVSAMGLPGDVSLFAARVHELGRQALEDDTPERRAERFSMILSDCANCHAELGVQ